jgi:hypothetical protein
MSSNSGLAISILANVVSTTPTVYVIDYITPFSHALSTSSLVYNVNPLSLANLFASLKLIELPSFNISANTTLGTRPASFASDTANSIS